MLLFMEWNTYLLGACYLAAGGLVYLAYSKGAKRTLERERVIRYLMAKQARKEYKILVPVGNPDTMKSLVTVAAAIAKKFDGEILLLSVVEVPYYVPLERGVARAGDFRSQLMLAEKICEREGVDDVKRMIKISHRLSHGILETAREENCNFIVMGRVSRRTLGDRLLATVIDAVLDDAPCDVAVVRPGAGDLTDVDRILVAVSGHVFYRRLRGKRPGRIFLAAGQKRRNPENSRTQNRHRRTGRRRHIASGYYRIGGSG